MMIGRETETQEVPGVRATSRWNQCRHLADVRSEVRDQGSGYDDSHYTMLY